MAQQKCKLKIGQTYWEAFVFEGKFEWYECILRTIRKENEIFLRAKYTKTRAHFVRKEKDITWVRKSKKVGDYGWAKSFDSFYRTSKTLTSTNGVIDEMQELPLGIFTTKLKAVEHCLSLGQKDLKRADRFKVEDTWSAEDTIEHKKEIKRNITAVKRAITRLKKEQQIRQKIRKERRSK